MLEEQCFFIKNTRWRFFDIRKNLCRIS